MTDDLDRVFGLCETPFFSYYDTRLRRAAAIGVVMTPAAPASQPAPPRRAEVAHDS